MKNYVRNFLNNINMPCNGIWLYIIKKNNIKLYKTIMDIHMKRYIHNENHEKTI